MISFDDVFAQTAELVSADEQTSETLRFFCEAAVATMNHRLKPDADASDRRLILATAALARFRYLQALCDDESDMISLKAGDVTVRKDSNAAMKRAEQFCRETLSDVRELLIDTAFIFAAI